MTKRRIKIDIPIRQPEKLIELAEAIYKKYKTDPIIDSGIDFQELYNKSAEARQKRHKAKEIFEKSKQTLLESNAFLGIGKGQNKATKGTIYHVVLQIRDYLKSLNKGMEENLKLWGYDVEIFQIRGLRKVKVYIPISNQEHLISLAEDIYSRSKQEPSMLKNYNLKDFYSKSQKAKQKRQESKSQCDAGDMLMEESNLLLGIGYGQTKETQGTVYNQVNLILKFLLEKYKDTEEKLNDWGFKATVVTSNFPIKGSGVTTKKITAITHQYPVMTLHIIFKGSNGKKVYVSWGDETADKINLIGHTTPNSIYHDYSEEGIYEIQVSGDIGKLSFFKISGNQIVSIDIPRNLKNMSNVYLKNNMIESQKIINDVFSNLDSSGVFNGELDTSGGTNAKPSSFGTIAKNNLQSRGWEIITN